MPGTSDGGPSQRDRPKPPSFNRLVALELDPTHGSTAIDRRAGGSTEATSDGALVTSVGEPDEQAPDTFGLALSGGGIRSATFNLGLLQELHAQGILRVFDYIATVSGGGYVGGWLSAWRAWRARSGDTAAIFPVPPSAAVAGAPTGEFTEPEEIRHLREYGNFLAPRLGVLSYDTGRLVIAAVSATLPSLLAALSAIALALAAWLYLAASILDGQSGAWFLVGIAGVVLISAEVLWVRRGERWSWWYAFATLQALAFTAAFWWLRPLASFAQADLYNAASWPLPVIGPTTAVAGWATLFVPAGVWIGVALSFTMARWLISEVLTHRASRTARAAHDRVTSRLLFAGVAWFVIGVIWIAGVALVTSGGGAGAGLRLTGIAGTTAALAALFGVIQKAISKLPGTHHFGGRIKSWIRSRLPQIVGYATLVGMILLVVAIAIWVGGRPGQEQSLLAAAGVATAFTLITLVFFNPNEVGLHSFYRARIARAFLGAWNRGARRETEEIEDDDLPLDRLSPERPLHLICCAANDLSSEDHLANLHRGATSAVLSRVGFSVGSDWTAWPTTGAPVPTLASAVTASAAAFNSHMGSLSMAFGPAVTFVMTALNLRLGLWLPHPTRFARPWYRRPLPGFKFYRELLGFSRANGSSVHLSDGGHFENMALYELIRRHCRFIIASDCGADPDVSFDDLGNLVRRVREDFGVEIEIDLEPLSPKESGLARQPMVAGDIHYPNGDTGVMLLFKPTLVGNEPPDITQYKRRNAAFPHESTGDQFYDEAQWESYRRLGVHAARAAFHEIIRECERPHLNEVPAHWGARVFARSRMRWQAMPPGLETRLPRLVDRATELDSLLRTSGSWMVLREVYREVDDIDGIVGARSGNGSAGDGVGAGDERPALPNAPSLAESLHAIRRAILFMEETFHTENLARTYNHPLYLGLINYFARWAYAPLFRMWWPTLKALYSERFTAFMEEQYGLTALPAPEVIDPALDAQIITELTSGQHGFAMDSWRMHTDRDVRAGEETVLSYELQVRYRSARCRVQAAQAVVRIVDTTAVWDASNFFVPPGLWGIGIGEDFLDRLVTCRGAVFATDGPLAPVTHLLVRIPVDSETTPALRKERADRTQMYRAAGFREVWVRSARLDGDGVDTALLASEMPGEARWLLRCLTRSTGSNCRVLTHGRDAKSACDWSLVDSRSVSSIKPGAGAYSSRIDPSARPKG